MMERTSGSGAGLVELHETLEHAFEVADDIENSDEFDSGVGDLTHV